MLIPAADWQHLYIIYLAEHISNLISVVEWKVVIKTWQTDRQMQNVIIFRDRQTAKFAKWSFFLTQRDRQTFLQSDHFLWLTNKHGQHHKYIDHHHDHYHPHHHHHKHQHHRHQKGKGLRKRQFSTHFLLSTQWQVCTNIRFKKMILSNLLIANIEDFFCILGSLFALTSAPVGCSHVLDINILVDNNINAIRNQNTKMFCNHKCVNSNW